MLDWYLFLTPLLVLPIVALFVFAGCALQESSLTPFVLVTFRVIFDPTLGREDALFDILVEIVPDNDPELLILASRQDQEPDDRTDDGRFVFTIEKSLWPRDYAVTCSVRAYVNGNRVNAGHPIVQSEEPCPLVFPNGGEVTFEAYTNSPWFERCN